MLLVYCCCCYYYYQTNELLLQKFNELLNYTVAGSMSDSVSSVDKGLRDGASDGQKKKTTTFFDP